MAAQSNIEWTDATWPIVQGCDPVSQGCVHCYAVQLLWRMMHNPDPKISGPLQGVVEKHINAAGEEILRFTGKVALRADRLTWPLKWKTPRMIFVPSHGDLFHKDVPDAFIDKVFAVMALAPQHQFQVLTKRAERMLAYLNARNVVARIAYAALEIFADNSARCSLADWDGAALDAGRGHPPHWPLPNVWFGVSAEDQANADERIPHLLATPAAIRFVSLEPLLGPIDLWNGDPDPRLGGHQATHTFLGDWWEPGDNPKGPSRHGVDWVIVGGESGKAARPMHPDWARSLRDQCAAADVPFFFKQWGAWGEPILNGEKHLVSNDGRHVDDRQWDKALDFHHPVVMSRVGKTAAGRLLDGHEHSEFPPRVPNILSQPKENSDAADHRHPA